jgi:apolipoprotein N-acyltransferase
VVHNVAEVFSPTPPRREYLKQHLVPHLESDEITPGTGILMTSQHTGVAVCKDMDFVALGRQYSQAGSGLLFVPAWDFDKDAWVHGSMAILRGVEGGYSIARSARDGLLTATDWHGRLLSPAVSSHDANAMIVADIPVGPGNTTYSRIGDAFGWFCVVLSLGLLVGALAASRSAPARSVAAD